MVDIYASMTPAKDVGGDFYDFFQIDDERIGLVIADVSGKGVPASLFMAVSRTCSVQLLFGVFRRQNALLMPISYCVKRAWTLCLLRSFMGFIIIKPA